MNWKAIPGPTPDYEIREDGAIRSFKTGEWVEMKPRIHKVGYYMVALSYQGKPTKQYLHRILAQAFIPNPNNLPEINHKNGIKTDNSIENLEWVTHKRNMEHAKATGIRKPQKSKYSDEQVRAVLLKWSVDGLSQTEISAALGIPQQFVSLFLSGYRTKYKSVREMREAIGKKHFIGESHPMSVLSDEEVMQIKQQLAGGKSAYQIFKEGGFGVSYPTINSIMHGKTWSHVTI